MYNEKGKGGLVPSFSGKKKNTEWGRYQKANQLGQRRKKRACLCIQ
jgi:hypothetical protein